MAQKFLLSFLGTNAYQQTAYRFQNQPPSAGQHYALLGIFDCLFADKWTAKDCIYVLTTERAYQNNYLARVERQANGDQVLRNDGLQYQLQERKDEGQLAHFEALRIPDVEQPNQIWSVFNTIIYDGRGQLRFPSGSEVILDITNAYRFLPMLVSVFMQYLKSLQAEGEIPYRFKIYYGNFEAKREGIAPIFDLSDLLLVQDWSIAAHAFLRLGQARFIQDLLLQTPQEELGHRLADFSKILFTCRGQEVINFFEFDIIKKQLDEYLESQSEVATQLKPLISKVKHKLEPFNNRRVENGFAAVEFCIEHGMTQQGYTFLRENIVNYVIARVAPHEMSNPVHRSIAEGILWRGNRNLLGTPGMAGWRCTNCRPPDAFHAEQMYHERYLPALNYYWGAKAPIFQELCQLFQTELVGHSGLRNDISHCGMTNRAALPEHLVEHLRQLYLQTCRLVALLED